MERQADRDGMYGQRGLSSAPAYYNLSGAIPTFSQVGVFDSYAVNWAVSIGASTWNIFASSANILLNGAGEVYHLFDKVMDFTDYKIPYDSTFHIIISSFRAKKSTKNNAKSPIKTWPLGRPAIPANSLYSSCWQKNRGTLEWKHSF